MAPGNGLGGVCMVVGANRGIGLALTEMMLENAAVEQVIAVHRPGADCDRLQLLSDRFDERLQSKPLDFTDDGSLDDFTVFLKSRQRGINLTLHTVGILHADGLHPEKTFKQCRRDHLQHLFAVNSIFPLLVAQALLSAQPGKQPFVFAALSAMVGSIGDNRLGGWYGYRASKCALNQFIKTLSIECRIRFPQAAIVAIHPGTTDTDLSRPFQRNVQPEKLYSPRQTASRILNIVQGLDEHKSGQFLNWDGHQIPW